MKGVFKMKTRKLAGIITILTLVLMMLVGCSTKKVSAYKYELEENPTTGYRWVYEIKDNTTINITDEFIPAKGDKVGAPGVHEFMITGLKSGETDITFTLKQDWDGGQVSEEKNIHVLVDSNLQVTINK